MAAGGEWGSEKQSLCSWKELSHHGNIKELSRCCSQEPTPAALRGAEGSVSFPSVGRFLSCIDVASHYCEVPINPPFIRPRLLIHFFPLPHISNSVCLIPIFFSFLLHSEGKCQTLSLSWVCELCRGKGGRSKGGGRAVMWPPFQGLKMKDLYKCQPDFDGETDRIEPKRLIYILTIVDSSQSNRLG